MQACIVYSVRLRKSPDRRRNDVDLSELKCTKFFIPDVEEMKAVDGGPFADYKSRVAFLFPGQGAQKLGMAKEVVREVPAAQQLFDRASDVLGYDLLKLCIEGPKEKLDSTVISQPALFVCGLAAVEKLKSTHGQVEALCAEATSRTGGDAFVQIANYLCPGNYTVSGTQSACQTLQDIAKPEFKARMTVKLPVAGAFHTRCMSPAVASLKQALASTPFATPRIPVVSNVDARPHSDPEGIKTKLAEQITSPVRWEQSIREMLDRGLERSYELGPGTVISGIFKRIDKAHKMENIEV